MNKTLLWSEQHRSYRLVCISRLVCVCVNLCACFSCACRCMCMYISVGGDRGESTEVGGGGGGAGAVEETTTLYVFICSIKCIFVLCMFTYIFTCLVMLVEALGNASRNTYCTTYRNTFWTAPRDTFCKPFRSRRKERCDKST